MRRISKTKVVVITAPVIFIILWFLKKKNPSSDQLEKVKKENIHSQGRKMKLEQLNCMQLKESEAVKEQVKGKRTKNKTSVNNGNGVASNGIASNGIESSSGINDLGLDDGEFPEDGLMASSSHCRRNRTISVKKNGLVKKNSLVKKNGKELPLTEISNGATLELANCPPRERRQKPVLVNGDSAVIGNTLVSNSCNGAIVDTNLSSTNTAESCGTDENSLQADLSDGVEGDSIQTSLNSSSPCDNHKCDSTTSEMHERTHENFASNQIIPVNMNYPAGSPMGGNLEAVGSECLLSDDSGQGLSVSPHEADLPDSGQGPSDSPHEADLPDSGQGLSDSPHEADLPDSEPDYCMVYECVFFPEDTGLLIGKNGRNVKGINRITGAAIRIRKHPIESDKNICSIQGTEAQISHALEIIRERFPLDRHPLLTLEQINCLPVLQCPQPLKLSLPDGVFELVISSMMSPGHFFIQQPTHSTFHHLLKLSTAMTTLYSSVETPTIEDHTTGVICAASVHNGWYRAEVCDVCPVTEQCRLRFLDFGGYALVPKMATRKIRYDFMTLPFQATECYLAGVLPIGEDWSIEASRVFEGITLCKVLQAVIVGYTTEGVPCVNLYKVSENTHVFINKLLVELGFAKEIPVVE